MSLLERIHEEYVFGRRVRALGGHCARVIPKGASVLDIGCGDGLLARMLMRTRPDLALRGIDTLVRQRTHIPVEPFDGRVIPYPESSFDVVMFMDVLHHTEDPMILLREASRVARKTVIIKDHAVSGLFAVPTLRFMDRVGNSRHGVALPCNYWTEQRWRAAFDALGWIVDHWEKDLGLYPWPASWIFGRSLHFLSRFSVGTSPAPSERNGSSDSAVCEIPDTGLNEPHQALSK